MVSSYYVPLPDLPAIFESLNDDTLTTVLEFVGRRSYRSFGRINKRCKEVYITSGMVKETFLYGYATLSRITGRIERRGRFDVNQKLYERVGKGVVFYNRRDVMDWALQRQNIYSLKGICVVAAKEEKYDVLNEVLNNIENENDERDIFFHVVRCAVRHGKLNVIKWIETKGLYFSKEGCAKQAAEYGQLHILKWLHEEKGLCLDEILYFHAAGGQSYEYAACGHLHVMKWLREQEVDWHERTFKIAAEKANLKGNLEILQWLHNEGCPWDRTLRARVCERLVKPEVIDWCRSNGYGDRLVFNMRPRNPMYLF